MGRKGFGKKSIVWLDFLEGVLPKQKQTSSNFEIIKPVFNF